MAEMIDTLAPGGAATTQPASAPEPLLLTLQNMYDPVARAGLADRALDMLGHQFPEGTVQRARFLLEWIETGHPSHRMQTAYMDNLRQVLRDRPARDEPGKLVIGLGTGRSGSTTLSHILNSCGESCGTHENPPMLYWKPRPEQIAFHLQRFALLRRHFALVSDVAHWWINTVDVLVRGFPDIRFIGLIRDRDACVESFLTIKGVGPGSLNHWLPRDAPGYRPVAWDLAYPSYPSARPERDQEPEGKRRLIGRYVDEYNARLERLAAADPARWLLLRTETLDAPETRLRIYAHVGGKGHFAPVRLNAGTIADGTKAYRF